MPDHSPRLARYNLIYQTYNSIYLMPLKIGVAGHARFRVDRRRINDEAYEK